MSRNATVIARIDDRMDEFLDEYVAKNGLGSKSEAVRELIGKEMDGNRSERFGEMSMEVPMDLSTYEDVNDILTTGGFDIKSIFYKAFSLWKKDLVSEDALTERILKGLEERSNRVYDAKERAQREGMAKKA